ncbi:apoptosis inhibitor 5-B-like [Daphnia pulicaria]|uniref:apoptosis inhibitor 5-B-like n=1 Tax=Daphnia pulicaria TaxID=35523 RepID=UPI001EEA859D|nr:apoptosis inhibitor 5-B-like [Daphnia pulicaria]
MDIIDKLYQHYEILNEAKDDIAKHRKEYEDILLAVKGSDKEKKLASQFIAKFAKSFPDLENETIDAMFDLCEDDDVLIRKQAIKDLVNICKDNKGAVRKIAYALAQILQSEDNSEVTAVHNSIASLYQIDPAATIEALFSELAEDNEIMRERTLKMLAMKLRTLETGVMKPEVKELLVKECKKILQDVTADEFVLVMAILGQCKIADSVSGQQQLVDLVAEQCNFTQVFNPADQEHLDRIIICIKHALPYFSTQVKSTAFVSYICDQVLPHRNEIGQSEQKLDIFKLLAELSSNCGPLDPVVERIQIVYDTLLEYMPLPPPVLEETNGDGSTTETEIRLEFTFVESLIFAFHQLARQHREFLTDNADRSKDFRSRLQYFARGVQGYIKKLRESLQDKGVDQLRDEEGRIKVTALRTTSNINSLIRDLFRNPPSYKVNVTLSFKPTNASQAAKQTAAVAVNNESTSEAAGVAKRHAPITFESSPPKVRVNTDNRVRQPYVVPTGKFSANVSAHGADSRPRGRGGYRGGRGYRRGGY